MNQNAKLCIGLAAIIILGYLAIKMFWPIVFAVGGFFLGRYVYTKWIKPNV